MKPRNYKPRLIDDLLNKYLKTFPVIVIEGPKWCGKTWTGKNAASSEFLLMDPKDNFNNRLLANISPELILDGEKPRLIDEWQEVPTVWDAVRGKVDQINEKGQFILTGSSAINKDRYVHSGTGRMARLRMRPMSLYESGYSNGLVSLKDICLGQFENRLTGEVSLYNIIDYILIGGWPSNINVGVEEGTLVAREYIKSVLDQDIFKVDNVKRDPRKINLLFKSLARNESTTVTNNTLKNDIKEKDYDDISIDTLSEYLNLLDKLYLIENIPPFAPSIRSKLRVKQSDKRHFVDPSLPCAILQLSKEKLLSNLNLLGFLFESMVLRDLLTYVSTFGAKLYHYQDYNNNEIDAVIELDDSSWCAFEIKLGTNQIEEAAQNLLRINKKIHDEGGQKAKTLCVICGLGNAAYKRDDGVYVVPITALKN